MSGCNQYFDLNTTTHTTCGYLKSQRTTLQFFSGPQGLFSVFELIVLVSG